MPVEIREMVVKAIVPAKNKEVEAQTDAPAEKRKPMDQAKIVEACVAAVMRILEKKERR
jgi:hypothetical protein